MAGTNEFGFLSERGPRDYRPEYPPFHIRQHNVFWPKPSDVAGVVKQLKSANALHRAAFLAAAYECQGLFLDLMQVPDRIPVPPAGTTPFCAILNDDEPLLGGARGPNFFDAGSLLELVGRVRTVVVVSVGVRASVYAIACQRTVLHRENSLLIETQPNAERAWMAYVAANARDCRYTLVKEDEAERQWLAENMLKSKKWMNPF